MKNKEQAAVASKRRNSQQEAYWYAFANRLETIEKTYGISKSDIAEGLDISRQSLYNFVNRPQKGIRIDRSSIIQLYDYIRFEESEALKCNQEFARNRGRLNLTDLNDWLQEAGYALEQAQEGSITQNAIAIRDHQVKRIVFRLTSRWIPDDNAKNYLINNFLDQILDQSRLDDRYYSESLRYLHRTRDKTERSRLAKRRGSKDDRSGYDVLSFSENILYKDETTADKDVQKKYEKAIQFLSQSGKSIFVRAELFELYQSILEHHYIGQSSPIRITTSDCRFKSLSFNLFERPVYRKKVKEKPSDLDRQMRRCSEMAEREIRGLNLAFKDDEHAYINSSPILEAFIRCQLKRKDGKDIEEPANFSIRYSSNATHVETLLLALRNGFCYPLGITSFFMRATGRSEKSLARVSITLSDKTSESTTNNSNGNSKEEYAGWWITSDTLIGIQNATIDAFRRWLSDRPFPQESHCEEKYLRLCSWVANVKNNLAIARRALYEHTPRPRVAKAQTLKEFIQKEILDEAEKIRTDPELSEIIHQPIFESHQTQLNDAVNIAKLLIIRTSLIQSEACVEDEKYINERTLQAIVADLDSKDSEAPGSSFSQIVRSYAIACKMIHKFVTGDQEFILGKQWEHNPEYSLEQAIKRTKRYVSSQSSVVDLDTYLSMADIYGTRGLIEFYSGRSMEQLEHALEDLIKAAHFSLKISFRKIAAQWLCYASRVCIRQGKLSKASYILSLVTGIADDAVLGDIETQTSGSEAYRRQHNGIVLEDLPHSIVESKNWDDINWLLAQGEMLLSNEPDRALTRFMAALNIAIVLQFSRIIPDCLYNLHRAAKQLSERKDDECRTLIRAIRSFAEDIGGKSPSVLMKAYGQTNQTIDKELHMFVSNYLMKMEEFMGELADSTKPLFPSDSCKEKDAEGIDRKRQDEYCAQFQNLHSQVSQDALELAIAFWNSWRTDTNADHPIAQAIQQGIFLAKATT